MAGQDNPRTIDAIVAFTGMRIGQDMIIGADAIVKMAENFKGSVPILRRLEAPRINQDVIGSVLNVRAEDGKLVVTLEFDDDETFQVASEFLKLEGAGCWPGITIGLKAGDEIKDATMREGHLGIAPEAAATPKED